MLSEKQKIFLRKSIEEKVGGGRSSFTFIVETEEQLNMALNALYKSGCKWWYRNQENEKIESEIKTCINFFEKVRIRVRYDNLNCGILMLYSSFQYYSPVCDLSFNEVIKFLAYLRKGCKEIERRK